MTAIRAAAGDRRLLMLSATALGAAAVGVALLISSLSALGALGCVLFLLVWLMATSRDRVSMGRRLAGAAWFVALASTWLLPASTARRVIIVVATVAGIALLSTTKWREEQFG
jgi:hypothetical protein